MIPESSKHLISGMQTRGFAEDSAIEGQPAGFCFGLSSKEATSPSSFCDTLPRNEF
jgi:hypothetical protein